MMMAMMIEDFSGKTELMLWGDDYMKLKNYLEKGKNILVQGYFKQRYNSEEYEFKVASINLLEATKQNFTKQLIIDVSPKAINSEFISFIEKNVKRNPGNSSIKFNFHEPMEDIQVSMYSIEKGFTMNDEMASFLDENIDVDVKVVTV